MFVTLDGAELPLHSRLAGEGCRVWPSVQMWMPSDLLVLDYDVWDGKGARSAAQTSLIHLNRCGHALHGMADASVKIRGATLLRIEVKGRKRSWDALEVRSIRIGIASDGIPIVEFRTACGQSVSAPREADFQQVSAPISLYPRSVHRQAASP